MAKILIVDDSRTSRKILRGILEGGGHEIIGEASNGEEGVINYKELKPPHLAFRQIAHFNRNVAKTLIFKSLPIVNFIRLLSG